MESTLGFGKRSRLSGVKQASGEALEKQWRTAGAHEARSSPQPIPSMHGTFKPSRLRAIASRKLGCNLELDFSAEAWRRQALGLQASLQDQKVCTVSPIRCLRPYLPVNACIGLGYLRAACLSLTAWPKPCISLCLLHQWLQNVGRLLPPLSLLAGLRGSTALRPCRQCNTTFFLHLPEI